MAGNERFVWKQRRGKFRLAMQELQGLFVRADIRLQC